MSAAVIAVLGAESTGKTLLCEALVRHWTSVGRQAVMVGEVLREFCAEITAPADTIHPDNRKHDLMFDACGCRCGDKVVRRCHEEVESFLFLK